MSGEDIYRKYDLEDRLFRTDIYSNHLDRMTREGLHSKSDIAMELAFRDAQIKELLEQVKRYQDIVKSVAHIGVDFGYGKYEVEDKYIEQAREYFDNNNS